MTRVNVGIEVSRLPDKQLLAEHREIKRLPRHLAKFGFNPEKLKQVPNKFKLGTGHVLFMICKGKFTHFRYIELYWECRQRGFNVTNYEKNWDVYNNFPILYNNYVPTESDIRILLNRFKERNIKLIKANEKRSTN